MHAPGAGRVVEGNGHFGGGGALRRVVAQFADYIGQALAFDQLHRVKVGRAFGADGIHRDDVGVVEVGGGLGLVAEPLQVPRVQCRGQGQDLERDPAAEGQLLGLVHHAHAAAADFPEEAEVAQRLTGGRVTGGAIRPRAGRPRRLGLLQPLDGAVQKRHPFEACGKVVGDVGVAGEEGFAIGIFTRLQGVGVFTHGGVQPRVPPVGGFVGHRDPRRGGRTGPGRASVAVVGVRSHQGSPIRRRRAARRAHPELLHAVGAAAHPHGDFGRRQPFDVAEHEHLAVAGGQRRQGVGQDHRLLQPRGVPDRGGSRLDEAPVQHSRRGPGLLVQVALPLDVVGLGPEVAAQDQGDPARQNPPEPREELGLARPAEAGNLAVGFEESILNDVAGVHLPPEPAADLQPGQEAEVFVVGLQHAAQCGGVAVARRAIRSRTSTSPSGAAPRTGYSRGRLDGGVITVSPAGAAPPSLSATSFPDRIRLGARSGRSSREYGGRK